MSDNINIADYTEMSKTREDPIGSPIVKSVFQQKCKRKLCPVPIPAKDTSSDWSTVDQSTIGTIYLYTECLFVLFMASLCCINCAC